MTLKEHLKLFDWIAHSWTGASLFCKSVATWMEGTCTERSGWICMTSSFRSVLCWSAIAVTHSDISWHLGRCWTVLPLLQITSRFGGLSFCSWWFCWSFGWLGLNVEMGHTQSMTAVVLRPHQFQLVVVIVVVDSFSEYRMNQSAAGSFLKLWCADVLCWSSV